MKRPPGSTNRATPPMNRKLQAEKQAQPSGMRVKCRAADEPCRPGCRPGRCRRASAARSRRSARVRSSAACSRVSSRRRSRPRRAVPAARPSCERERISLRGRPVRALRTGRIGRIHLAACAARRRRRASGRQSEQIRRLAHRSDRAHNVPPADGGTCAWAPVVSSPSTMTTSVTVMQSPSADCSRPRSPSTSRVTPGRVSLSQVAVVPTRRRGPLPRSPSPPSAAPGSRAVAMMASVRSEATGRPAAIRAPEPRPSRPARFRRCRRHISEHPAAFLLLHFVSANWICAPWRNPAAGPKQKKRNAREQIPTQP